MAKKRRGLIGIDRLNAEKAKQQTGLLVKVAIGVSDVGGALEFAYSTLDSAGDTLEPDEAIRLAKSILADVLGKKTTPIGVVNGKTTPVGVVPEKKGRK